MAPADPVAAPEHELSSKHFSWIDILRLAAMGAIVLVVVWILCTHSEWFRDPRRVRDEILSWGDWGPVVFILAFSIGPSFLIPGFIMIVAGGLAFGPLWGAIYSIVGANIGAVIAFGAGRALGRSLVERSIGKRFDSLLQRIARNGFQIILYLRLLIPIVPYTALNLVAGVSRIEFRDYFMGSLLGLIPGTILFAYLGSSLWHPLSFGFFVAVGLIMVCLACGEFYRRHSALKME